MSIWYKWIIVVCIMCVLGCLVSCAVGMLTTNADQEYIAKLKAEHSGVAGYLGAVMGAAMVYYVMGIVAFTFLSFFIALAIWVWGKGKKKSCY